MSRHLRSASSGLRGAQIAANGDENLGGQIAWWSSIRLRNQVAIGSALTSQCRRSVDESSTNSVAHFDRCSRRKIHLSSSAATARRIGKVGKEVRSIGGLPVALIASTRSSARYASNGIRARGKMQSGQQPTALSHQSAMSAAPAAVGCTPSDA